MCISSVQFSRSVVSDSLRPYELQHARPPCPSPTPGVQSDSRPSSQWRHPAISSSVIPFSSCPQSLPASESFPMSQLFAWGGQSTGVSALASFLPKKSQDWSPSEWTGWISLHSAFFIVQLSHPYMTARKTIALTGQTFVGSHWNGWASWAGWGMGTWGWERGCWWGGRGGGSGKRGHSILFVRGSGEKRSSENS